MGFTRFILSPHRRSLSSLDKAFSFLQSEDSLFRKHDLDFLHMFDSNVLALSTAEETAQKYYYGDEES